MKHDQLRPDFRWPIPEVADMEPGVLYVCEKYMSASHLCACGCGNEVVTPLGEGGWSLTDDHGLVSLSPSIGNWNLPCRSHYFIRSNKVDWC